jgi:DNA-binding PucR family transcriptional regulator
MLVWLELGMNTVAVARRMNVHPQTVRYRVQRIKELFGYELEDTQHRFELMLALRVAVLLSSTTGG